VKNMKIAITGSEGFLGKIISKKLDSEGHTIVECNRKNCDILNPKQVLKALKGSQAVVHCAAQLEETSKDIYEVNVRGTENVLEACSQNGISHFIFLSTVGVYGNLGGIKTEQTEPSPQTEYEKSKLEAEKKVLSYQEVFHITILRPALVIGKNKYWERIISTIKKGYPLIGEGKNKWQLVSDQDVASAVAFCIDREECFGESFIVAEKEALTLEQIVKIVRKELGMSEQIRKIPLWLGNIIAAINSILNFNPILKPAYVKRMQSERSYSTEKLEKLGWKAQHSTKEYLPQIVRNI